MIRWRLLLPVVCLAVAVSSAARGQDTVVILNPQGEAKPQSGGVVVEETLDAIKYAKGGGERSYKTDRVSAVVYGKGSDSYERGLAALAANDLVNAENLFATAAEDDTPGWVASHALLKQAEAAARRGASGLPAARDAVGEFLRRYPEHRLLPKALLIKAAYAARSEDSATVDQSVESVLSLVSGERVTPDWAARAHLLRADVQLADGRTNDARSSYASAESAAGSTPAARPDLEAPLAALRLQARVGTASCMLASGDVPGARSYYVQLASDGANDPDVQIAAANGLAECTFRESGKLKQAQLAFAQVSLTAAGTPDEHARSLYFLGRCAEELGKTGAEPNARTKSSTYYQSVIQRYPDSRWARLAQESLP